MGTKCIESILIYGVSGAGKTTQGQELAIAVQRRLKKKTRLVSCSGGGWTSIQPAIDQGLIEPAFIAQRKFGTETLDKMSKGYWPAHPDDPESPLVPPGEQKDWKDVGGLMFDSMTEMCSWMMGLAVASEARGDIKISQQPIKSTDGGTTYGTPGLAHYGVYQNRIETFVGQSKGLPGVYVFWTALELKASDDNTKLPLYGPDVVGKAKTGVAPAWFDNTLHLYQTGQGGLKKGAVERRLYFETHFEDDGIPYVAKNRGHLYSPLVKLVGNPYLEKENLSIDYFLTLLERSHREAGEILKNRLSKIN